MATAPDPACEQRTDGSEAGASLVKDINPGEGVMIGGETLFFAADDGVNGVEICKSDGTEAGIMLVRNINEAEGEGPGLNSFIEVTGALLFVARCTNRGDGLWRSDGTEAGIVLIEESFYEGYLLPTSRIGSGFPYASRRHLSTVAD